MHHCHLPTHRKRWNQEDRSKGIPLESTFSKSALEQQLAKEAAQKASKVKLAAAKAEADQKLFEQADGMLRTIDQFFKERTNDSPIDLSVSQSHNGSSIQALTLYFTRGAFKINFVFEHVEGQGVISAHLLPGMTNISLRNQGTRSGAEMINMSKPEALEQSLARIWTRIVDNLVQIEPEAQKPIPS